MQPTRMLATVQNNQNTPNIETLASHPILSKALSPNKDKLLENAQLYRHDIVKDLQTSLSWEEFKTFLVLYSYAQPLSKDFSAAPFATQIPYEEALNRRPQSEFLKALHDIGISFEKISFFWDLLSFDGHALLIKGHVGKDEVLDVLYEKASKAGVKPEVFYAIIHRIHTLNNEKTPTSLLTRLQNSVANLIKKIAPNLGIALAPKLVAAPANQKKIDGVINHLFQSTTGEDIFFSLVNQLATQQDYHKVKKTFTSHISQLQCFLEKAHKEMLTSTRHSTKEQQEKFRNIKRGFRDILVYIQKNDPKPQELADHYYGIYTGRFAKELQSFRRDYLCRYSLPKVQRAVTKIQKEENAKKLRNATDGKTVFDECMKQVTNKNGAANILKYLQAENKKNTRLLKTYIEHVHLEMLKAPQIDDEHSRLANNFEKFMCCLCPDPAEKPKLETLSDKATRLTIQYGWVRDFASPCACFCNDFKLLKDNKSLSAEDKARIDSLKEELDPNSELPSFFEITFIHGTNAALLPNLEKSNYHLVCSGRLRHAGIIPFSGELREGTASTGININKISGTDLENAEFAIQYATNSSETSLENETFLIEDFISFFTENNKPHLFTSVYDSREDNFNEWMRVSIAIKRMRALYPEEWEKFEITLKTYIEKLESDWALYKKSEDYWENMPVDRYGLFKSSFWKRMKPATHPWAAKAFGNVEFTINSLKAALTDPIEAPSMRIQHSFPILFASNTTHTFPPRAESLESCAQKASQIGKDVQFIFVHEKDKPVVEDFLKNAKISASIHDFDLIRKSSKIYNIAKSYFSTYSKKLTANKEL